MKIFNPLLFDPWLLFQDAQHYSPQTILQLCTVEGTSNMSDQLARDALTAYPLETVGLDNVDKHTAKALRAPLI